MIVNLTVPQMKSLRICALNSQVSPDADACVAIKKMEEAIEADAARKSRYAKAIDTYKPKD